MNVLTGNQIIGFESSGRSGTTFRAFSPVRQDFLPEQFTDAGEQEINRAAELAESAFGTYSMLSSEEKASFLEAIAAEILNLDKALLERCHLETALPMGRLEGERGRTVSQIRLFADLLKEGSWVEARIDQAMPDRQPLPKPDIRQMLIPLGPVAVFGASNFPLAFSVAGGDTASALAAGCPVVCKGHPAHPGTSELVGKAITAAAQKTGMPEGVFSLVQGSSNQQGEVLVGHPLIQAVGFTGSFRGGKALFDLANRRAKPIPVFAEMGSVNPVFILPEAARKNRDTIAAGLLQSITLGVGQFCTNPGLVYVEGATNHGELSQRVSQGIDQVHAGTMLTPRIWQNYADRSGDLERVPGIVKTGEGTVKDNKLDAMARIYSADLSQLEGDILEQEIFGPSSILVKADSKEELLKAAHNLEGHLTATIHATEEELPEYSDLIDILRRKVGRLIINGYPTGVEVCHSMVHGGPFPATTSPQTTSVGTLAIRRFARPVCYQNMPDHMLPPELQQKNPLGIWRLVDGEFQK